MNDTVDAPSLTHRTLGAVLWSFSGSAVQAVLRIVVLVVLARLLAPAAFGIVSAALVVVYFTQNLAQMGIGPALVQRADLQHRHITAAFTLSLLFGIVLALLSWWLAPWIAAFFRMPQLTAVLRVILLVFPIRGLSIVAESLLTRDLKFRLLVVNDIVSYLAGYGLAGVVLALLGYGVWALVAAFLIQAAVQTVILLVLQPHAKALRLDRRSVSELVYFGGGQTLATILNYLALQGDNIVAGRWLGPTALGLYSRAYNLMATGVSLFAGVLDVVIFPAMSKIQHERTRLALAYRRGMSAMALVLFPISAFLFVVAPELITVLLGSKWAGAIVPFQILSWGVLLRSGYKVGGSVNRATGAVYAHAWRHVWYAAAVFSAAWVGAHWGVSGVALGVLAALLANYLFVSSLSLRMTAMSWREFVRAHLPGAFLGAMVGGVSAAAVTVLRGIGITPALTLVAAFLVAGLTVAALVRLVPGLLLGDDGLWLVQTISSYLPKNVVLLATVRRRLERVASSS